MKCILLGVCLVALFSWSHADPIACDPAQRPRVMTGPTGTFQSLNYPFNYPNNADCEWLIQAEPGHVIQIDFTAFNTERGYDIVWFFDGDALLSPALIGLSADRSPAPTGIAGSATAMYVWFSSDANTVATGFNATYTSVHSSEVTGECNPVSRPTMLESYAGTFESLFYPDPYPFRCECQWLIVSQEAGGFVQLDFLSFNTQANSDWVALYDGNSQSGTMLARLSGQYTPAPTGFVSSQIHMFVRFTSDEQLSIQGWRATYTSVAPAKLH